LCSLEYEIHRPLYDWVVEQCEFDPKPRQIEFARLNLTNTIMSKRYLRMLVEKVMSAVGRTGHAHAVRVRRRALRGSHTRFPWPRGLAKRPRWVDPPLLEQCVRGKSSTASARADGGAGL
jgi:glutaminyl-tRNA synthetase